MAYEGVKPGISVEEILENIHYKQIEDQIPNPTYDFVDFFCGCGGMSYGFHKIGERTGRFRWAGAFDINSHAMKTYESNFKDQPINMDLGNADIDDIKRSIKRNDSNELIVIGCAPCQGFSSHRKKDPRKDSRNSLVGRFAEIAVSLKPKLIIMENVPDLLANKHWHHYEAFKNVLEKSGYNITVKILNMADYGTPQARFRTVLLASRDFIPSLPEPVYTPASYKTVRDAIGWLPPLAAGEMCADDPMHMTSKHRMETIDILKHVPKDGGSRPRGIGPSCLDRVEGFYDVYGRLAWDRPAVTITARCRTPSCGRFAHPEQDRGLSVREAGLLQGFPSDFVFEGPFDDKFKQIGNAVSPIFSMRLAAHVLTLLAGKNLRETIENIEKPYFKSFSSLIAHIRQKGSESEGYYEAGI